MSEADTSISTKSIQETITDRIKVDFVGLIGDDAWQLLVQKTLDRFTAAPTSTRYDAPKHSPLQSMVDTAFREEAAAEIKKQVPALLEKWDMKKLVQDYLADHASALIQALLASVATATLANLANSIAYQIPQTTQCSSCNTPIVVPVGGGQCPHCKGWN